MNALVLEKTPQKQMKRNDFKEKQHMCLADGERQTDETME